MQWDVAVWVPVFSSSLKVQTCACSPPHSLCMSFLLSYLTGRKNQLSLNVIFLFVQVVVWLWSQRSRQNVVTTREHHRNLPCTRVSRYVHGWYLKSQGMPVYGILSLKVCALMVFGVSRYHRGCIWSHRVCAWMVFEERARSTNRQKAEHLWCGVCVLGVREGLVASSLSGK